MISGRINESEDKAVAEEFQRNQEDYDLEDYDTVEVEKETGLQEENEEDYPNLTIKIEQAQYSILS